MKKWYYRFKYRGKPLSEWNSFGHEQDMEPENRDQALDWAYLIRGSDIEIEVTEESD